MPVSKAARQRSYANRLGFVAEYGGVPAKPANSAVPTISGTKTVGQTLTGTNGTWTGKPTPAYSYQWFADGAAIDGATAITLVLAPAQAGKAITFVVTASSIAGSAAKSSAATTEIAGEAPANTVAPSITGTAQVGETLTAANGTWTGTPTPDISFQWKADDEAIDDATASTYEPVEADIGKVITVVATGTNLMGAASVTSAATDAVIAA